ncbi:MAG: hypothetical protein H6969_06745 [Gammaproteobacteria bacterium]|nr:hypothetical protein [Gammaproteobacteria bacterium]
MVDKQFDKQCVLATLPKLPFLNQYPVPSGNPSSFVIRPRLEIRAMLEIRARLEMDDLANDLIKALQDQAPAGLVLGVADEVPYVPNTKGVLRVIRTDRFRHKAKLDVLLRQQPDGLFVAFDIAANSPLTHLKTIVYGALFVMLWFLGMWLYFHLFDTDGLILQFAQKYGGGTTREVAAMLKSGVCFDQATGDFAHCGRGAGWFDLFRWDPPLFISYMTPPMGVIAGFSGLVLREMPAGLVYRPCQFLEWPSPLEFEAFVTDHKNWVLSVLSSVLCSRDIWEQQIQRFN